MEEMISFGHWLKLRRQALRLTQDALAGLVFCSAELIRKIEADARRPSPEIAERLARHLGLAPHQWATFVQVARAELQAGWLPAPTEVAALPAEPGSPMSRSLLPAPVTSLIGRAQELLALRDRLLRPEVRLLTLIGAPGIGKTRLALQVAADVRGTFADDVCFVALAPISDSGLVTATIAQALGVEETAGRSLFERLQAYLRNKHMLLLLDNFEQVLAAAPRVGELLAAAPRLKVLITSRAVLHLTGEHQFPVPPLALPDPSQPPVPERLAQVAAVELFVRRAQAVAPDFALTSANAAAVVAICQRLDGLPLAIELAAARSRMLAPPALLARLDRRLTLLASNMVDVPKHQRTLRSTIDWSYDLLDEQDQSLFRRLGVFVGGCTFEAVTTVCADAGIVEIDILNGVASLLDKSLLQPSAQVDGEWRVTMLETVREYALERLEQHGEAEGLRQRHAAYFLALTQEAQPYLGYSEQGVQSVWVDRLEREHNNLRAALAWSKTASDRAETGLQLVAAVWPLWYIHGHPSEGRAWLAEFLGRTSTRSAAPALRADALFGLAELAFDQNDYPTASVAYGESLAIAREQGDRERMTWSVHRLGFLAFSQGDYAAARAQIEECLTTWRALGNQNGCAQALESVGDIAWYQGDYAAALVSHEQSLALRRELGDEGPTHNLSSLGRVARIEGDYDRATVLCEESLAFARQHGHRGSMVWALHDLGDVARDQGKYERASELYQEALAIAQETECTSGIASMQNRLAEVAQAQGDYGRAGALHRESLRVFRDLGQKRDAALCLEGLAWVAEAQRYARRAAVLYGAVAALREASGAQEPPPDRANYARSVDRVRARLGEVAFAEAWHEGHTMPLEQVIAYALGEDD